MAQNAFLGLSPRVRGNPPASRVSTGGQGSIPASAGEPASRKTGRGLARVYPRECGGTKTRLAAGFQRRGLSPRVRGNREPRHVDQGEPGSIPASAGEPIWERRAATGTWVYPRECGGTPATVVLVPAGEGLSPRVRGNLPAPGNADDGKGSIPASAGEPARRTCGWATWRVYPRECGGTWPRMVMGAAATGLSPRVRGNRFRLGLLRRLWGSIPASAGEPMSPRRPHGVFAVYPRECGGTSVTPAAWPDARGLSPRVRGNPGGRDAAEPAAGSIPASAGEPAVLGRPCSRPWVYPRECGGTDWKAHAV